MTQKSHILDPLWITKGSGSVDPEYLKYILLAANKKFRESLESGDISGFNEILFHSLNLNNLAVEGTLFNFKLKSVLDNDKLEEIKRTLKDLYQVPDNILEVFKSANYLFVSLMIDYLDEILDSIAQCKIYFANKNIYKQNSIFLIANCKDSTEYQIWKLRFDKRLQLGHKLEYIKTMNIDIELEPELHKGIDLSSDPKLSKMKSVSNTMLVISESDGNIESSISSVASSISFTRGVSLGLPFNIEIMEELYDMLIDERVLPFTIKSWI